MDGVIQWKLQCKTSSQTRGAVGGGRGRRGKFLSTYLYKIFVEYQLLELETNVLGLMLENVYIGATALADNMACLFSTPEILQIKLNVGYRYSQQHHFEIQPVKTQGCWTLCWQKPFRIYLESWRQSNSSVWRNNTFGIKKNALLISRIE